MSDKMAEIIKKASELAQHAPEELREAAFQKAFDALIAESNGDMPSTPSRKKQTRKKAKRAAATQEDEGPNLDELDRTQYSDIRYESSLLDNCLRVLRAAKDDLHIDGLTGSDIARVLADKFRIPTLQPSVSRALNGAGQYVDRRTEGRKVFFRIMRPGEDYLDSGGSADSENATKARGKKKTKKKSPAAKKTSKKKKSAKKTTKKKSANKKASKKKASKRTVGPATILGLLLDNGFFQTSRTIADIIKQARDVHGRTIKANDLSPALLRFLRANKLSRERNADDQYEYKQP